MLILDVLACSRCAGRLRLITIIEAAVIQLVLPHLGLPDAVPTPSTARAPPLPIGAGERSEEDSDTDTDTDVD